MSNMTNYLENALANAVCRNVSYTSPANVYVALYSTPFAEDGSMTEITGNGYSRQSVTFSVPTDGVVESSGNVTFTASSGNTYTAKCLGIVDASSSGNVLLGVSIPTQTITDANSLTIDTGNLLVSFL